MFGRGRETPPRAEQPGGVHDAAGHRRTQMRPVRGLAGHPDGLGLDHALTDAVADHGAQRGFSRSAGPGAEAVRLGGAAVGALRAQSRDDRALGIDRGEEQRRGSPVGYPVVFECRFHAVLPIHLQCSAEVAPPQIRMGIRSSHMEDVTGLHVAKPQHLGLTCAPGADCDRLDSHGVPTPLSPLTVPDPGSAVPTLPRRRHRESCQRQYPSSHRNSPGIWLLRRKLFARSDKSAGQAD
ncbi:Uncharacterised protein [Mycobacteroides abscessus subsp. abscessus]|nr:Uncharacterised protein [Mycobacteroides abscessus subsp. abscessus]